MGGFAVLAPLELSPGWRMILSYFLNPINKHFYFILLFCLAAGVICLHNEAQLCTLILCVFIHFFMIFHVPVLFRLCFVVSFYTVTLCYHLENCYCWHFFEMTFCYVPIRSLH